MKKAKVILTAIAVFAVVGGALAFKAQKLGGSLYCTTVEGDACARDNQTPPQLITFSQNPTGTPSFCTSVADGDKCADVHATIKVIVDN